MRISSGEFKKFKIRYSVKKSVRPTRNFVKEQIFNILTHKFCIIWEHIHFIDMCCGSGQMGLEALSLGAKKVSFVDKDEKCLQEVLTNVKKLYLENRVTFEQSDLMTLGKSHEFKADICYADPPYGSEKIYHKILDCVDVKLLCLEAAPNFQLKYEPYQCVHTKRTGNAELIFLNK